jgi:hypothetical protein
MNQGKTEMRRADQLLVCLGDLRFGLRTTNEKVTEEEVNHDE